MVFEYNDPIIYKKRSGLKDNPYSDMVEDLIVDNNGKVYLTEEPDYYYKVKVEGLDHDWYEVNHQKLGAKTYRVDYKNKVVTFDKSHIGEQLKFSYKGKGLKFIPANSIYTQRDSLKIEETLQHIIDEGREGIENIYDLNEDERNRKKAESARVESENNREENESRRVEQEHARQSSESERIVQEEARQKDTYSAISEADTATDRANRAASNANSKADYAQSHGEYAKREADRLVGTDVSKLDSKVSRLEDESVNKNGDQMAGGLTFGNITLKWNKDLQSLDFVVDNK